MLPRALEGAVIDLIHSEHAKEHRNQQGADEYERAQARSTSLFPSMLHRWKSSFLRCRQEEDVIADAAELSTKGGRLMADTCVALQMLAIGNWQQDDFSGHLRETYCS